MSSTVPMIPAVPDYIGRNSSFADCPPGHRFGPYFSGWESGWRKATNKTPAFELVANSFPQHSRQALSAIRARQAWHAEQTGSEMLSFPARLSAPLATGLGNEHPLENGFAFITPYGLPYLAGSGVKGVLRRAAEELAGGEWGETRGWSNDSVNVLFGLEGDDDDDKRARGALEFWDLYFEPPAGKPVLAVEIMTPHHSGYLQSSGTPHANESPNPIPFLAVPASCECTLHVRCKPSLIPEAHAALRESWKALIEAAIEHAGDWLGFGAKTSVGYGRIEMDPKAQAEREAERQRLETERRQQEADAALATLPADGQLLSRLDDYLASLPADPRTGKTILQPTSGQHWLPALQILEDHVTGVSALEKPARETLATEVKKRLSGHFKVEGKADKAMKEKLAALRGS